MTDQPYIEATEDYDSRMQLTGARVFGERDTERRIVAIHKLYAENAVLYEPDASSTGHAAICEAVDTLTASLPPDFVFTAISPAVGHHSMGRLRWQAGPPSGPVAVTETEAARFQDGLIQTLHVFLDPPGA